MFFGKLTEIKRHPHFHIALIWLSVGVGAGALLWNGFMFSLDATSTTEFCISCHSMKAYVYEDYQQSVHYRNTTGIEADCADCHVPKPLGAKLFRKIIELKDVYHTILGTIDTPEKFAVKKQHLAERVWERMKATDSRECRNCHQFGHMDFDRQQAAASRQHRQAKELQKTCIDCHKGVAHKLTIAADDESGGQEDFSLE